MDTPSNLDSKPLLIGKAVLSNDLLTTLQQLQQDKNSLLDSYINDVNSTISFLLYSKSSLSPQESLRANEHCERLAYHARMLESFKIQQNE